MSAGLVASNARLIMLENVTNLSEAIEIAPNDPNLYIKRGDAYVEMSRFDEAVADYTKAIELNNSLSRPYAMRGVCYGAKGQYVQFSSDFNRAIELDPYFADYYVWRAGAYMGLNETDLALQDYDRAIDLDPNNPYPYAQKGFFFLNQGKFRSATNEANRALRIDPDYADAYVILGIIDFARNDLNSAEAHAKTAVALDESNSRGYNLLGCIASQKRAHADARHYAEEEINLTPFSPNGYIILSVACKHLGRYNESIEACNETIELSAADLTPERTSFGYSNRGATYIALGRYDAAVHDLTKAIELNPTNAYAYFKRAVAYESIGEHTLAREDHAKALEIDPDVDEHSTYIIVPKEVHEDYLPSLMGLPIWLLVIPAIICAIPVFYILRKRKVKEIIYGPAKDSVPHDVFISYSKNDKRTAYAICDALESNKIRCWIAPRNPPVGQNYQASIIDAIDASKIMVLVFSKSSNSSPHVLTEVSRAMSKGLTIIPFRLEAVPLSKEMEYLIGPRHWLDAVNPPLEHHITKLVDVITNQLKDSDNGMT
ncbi:hypothetical protein MchiMG62_19390 [Methanoculleus chikugoensis]|uniref:TIR domain-containing protein n=2 Tax=Methanoculleus chikugoensis TaxID=118126 RepID=A0ABM7H7K9_9EURY|nr:hypothetical protein MchiMG62_19390 [Methanoculleus chikugoensis]